LCSLLAPAFENIMLDNSKKTNAYLLLVLALLAIITYLPALRQPLIEDDYPNIRIALDYGPISGWEKMANDPVQRVRITSFTYMYGIYQLFGLQPAAFYAANILLHIFNCWLLFAIGRWRIIGWKVSFWAAAFFAVYEGHQEAIMWFSACNELLMFFFGFLSFLFWLILLESENGQWKWLVLSFLFLLLALISKESAVIFILLFVLPLLFPGRRLRKAIYLIPFLLIVIVDMVFIFMTRSHSFRFQDKSFVLTAPFWVTWIKSYGALLWIWGFAALISLIKWKEWSQTFLLSFVWIGISFIPYMFVDYMHRIPSRQIYLASTGLAWLVGATIVVMKERYGLHHKRIVNTVLFLILLHNVGYLWVKKHPQFLLRAEPTEQLLALAQKTKGKIIMKCFPRQQIIGDAALELMLNKPVGTLIWNEEEAQRHPKAATFCYEEK